MRIKFPGIILIITAIAFTFSSAAQQDSLSRDTVINDTARKVFLNVVKQRVTEEIKKNVDQFNADKIAVKQNEILENITKISQKANDYLRKGIDSAGIAAQLNSTLRQYDIAGDGIFSNAGTSHTQGNLATSSSLIKELLNRTTNKKQILDSYLKNLVSYRNKIDSLASDSILAELPADSVSLMNYLSKLRLMIKEMAPADSGLKEAIHDVQLLETRINLVIVKLEDGIEKIESYRKDLFSSISDREMANIWGPVAFRRPMNEIFALSNEKARLVLSFYSKNNSGKIALLLLLIAGVTIFIRNLREKITETEKQETSKPEHLVLKYPFLSALLIVISVFQFIFPAPPFIFSIILWTASAIALSFIFRGFITKYWMSSWLTMVIMFLLASTDNLILQASRTERWGMLFLSLAGIISGSAFLLSRRRKELKEKGIQIFISFLIIMELVSFFANLYGRYNLAKSFLTSGFFGLIIGIIFFWTVRLINETLLIAAQVYKTPARKILYINFEKVGKRVPPVFYYFLVIGWCILFGRNFYFFRKLTEPFIDFVAKERTIGAYTFTIQSIFIFFLILVLSGVISSIVTFFASGYQAGGTGRDKKTGIGSWLLLIRIAIISIGVLMAFAAAGIPMDRLAIILGALSVGIGFGLQSLVNNLVSGLILAFEKPINVGDVVEFGDQSGTMKSIGFRSSVITTWDGADVIIPNGNLLNQHLINWTRGNSSRRVEILIGVAYGTDLEKVKKLLLDLMTADERIMLYPQPLVLIKDFSSSSIDLRILFWIEHYDTWTSIKSEMISAIDTAFKKEGIKIPFPQQDLYIHSIPGDSEKKSIGKEIQ